MVTIDQDEQKDIMIKVIINNVYAKLLCYGLCFMVIFLINN